MQIEEGNNFLKLQATRNNKKHVLSFSHPQPVLILSFEPRDMGLPSPHFVSFRHCEETTFRLEEQNSPGPGRGTNSGAAVSIRRRRSKDRNLQRHGCGGRPVSRVSPSCHRPKRDGTGGGVVPSKLSRACFCVSFCESKVVGSDFEEDDDRGLSLRLIPVTVQKYPSSIIIEVVLFEIF